MAESSVQSRKMLKTIKTVLQILVNIIVYTVVILAVIRLAAWAYDFAYQIYGNVTVEEAPGRDIKVAIAEKEGTRAIASDLYDKGIIINENSFFIRTKLTTGSRHPVLPGTYTLNTSMNYEQILQILTKEVSAEAEGK